jgi:hypothetical protein
MTVTWNGSATLAAVRAGVVTGLQRGVEALRAEATSLVLNTPKTGRFYGKHQASAPGEPFASDTGDLLASASTSVDPAALTANLNYSSDHAAAMEYGTAKIAPRPYARPSIVNTRDAITADIAEEIGRALR